MKPDKSIALNLRPISSLSFHDEHKMITIHLFHLQRLYRDTRWKRFNEKQLAKETLFTFASSLNPEVDWGGEGI
jgi:hypothetical protein